MSSALRALRARLVTALVAVGLSASVGGLAVLATATPASAAGQQRCRSVSKHHYKTPHKDADRDGCDRHGRDDGDGGTT